MKIALAGNPNCGKTTIFNALTGANQRVGNYPGVTVERISGKLKLPDKTAEVVDLPGTYGLSAYSQDELVAREFIINEHPDLIVNVVDASNIDRNLYLTTQFMEMNIPVIITLNMVDVAKRRGIVIDTKQLSEKFGIPVVATNGRKEEGVSELIKEIAQLKPYQQKELSYGDEIDVLKSQIEEILKRDSIQQIPTVNEFHIPWLALKLAEEDERVSAFFKDHSNDDIDEIFTITKKLSKHIDRTLNDSLENLISSYRYGFITAILKGCVKNSIDIRKSVSDKIDLVVTHRVLGPVILLLVLWYMYQFVFAAAETPAGWLEAGFGWLHEQAQQALGHGMLSSLVVSGIIDGVGGVLSFTPLIVFMFFIIAIIEDSGYMARIAFLMDRVLRAFGMHGNSILAFIVSGGIAGGCAVPGIMAARTLRDPKEKLATLLTVPFMNCGAKLPVYALLIAAFFSNKQGKMMFLITITSWVFALLIALALRKTVLKGESTPFIMELPPYRFPTIKGLLIHTWQRTWLYVKKAGTLILAASIIMWVLMSFPKPSVMELGRGDAKVIASKELEYSIAGRVGKGLETVTKPLMGFEWRTNIALIAGLAAKEVIVSTLGTAYSLGDIGEENEQLSSQLAKDPHWNPVMAFSLIIFTILYMPCVATIAAIKKETSSWRWPIFSIFYTTTVAAIFAILVYQIGSLLFL